MKIGIIGSISGKESEFEAVETNRTSINFEFAPLNNEFESADKDAVLIFNNGESDIKKTCESLIKIKKMSVPVWIMTHDKEMQERYIYIQLGACGIVTSDFSIEEIGMVIHNSINLKNNPQYSTPKKRLSLDSSKLCLIIDEQHVFLTRTEFLLIDYLYRHQNQTCTYNDIVDEILKEGKEKKSEQYEKIRIANLIFKIREKLPLVANQEKEVIQTIRSVGYMMNSI